MQNLDSLRQSLENGHDWPEVYMFKFIAPADNRTFALLHDIFPEEARFFEKHSTHGKYLSITVKEMMLSADEVVERYRKALEIEGVIAL